MKVKSTHLLFIVNSLGFGGAEKQVVSLLNHLDTERFVISLACLKGDDPLMAQLKTIRLKSVFCCQVVSRLDRQAVNLIANYIDKNLVDQVVCTNQYPMLYGLWASRKAKRRCRVIEVFHTTLLPDFKTRLQWWFYRHLFRLCSHVVFVSDKQRKFWLESAGMKVQASSVIHNGINTAYFVGYGDETKKAELREEYGFTASDFVIGICAVLRPEKNHGNLIDAMAMAHRKGIDTKLLIIGDGPARQEIEQKVQDCRLEKDVVMTGFQEDVRPYISICDCMAIVSHSETFSIAALEAMAMAKPMIMSNIGGASEQVFHGQNGYLFEKGDVNALADYIVAMTDNEKRNKMAKAAQKLVAKQFTLEKMVGWYEDIFAAF